MISSEEFETACQKTALGTTELAVGLEVSRRTLDTWRRSGVPTKHEARVRSLFGMPPGEAAETAEDALVNVNVRLRSETVRQIDEMAAGEDRSRSQMVRLLLERAFRPADQRVIFDPLDRDALHQKFKGVGGRV